MRTKSLIALPVAAGLALGGASLATADDPPRPVKAPIEIARPGLPMLLHGTGPFGLDREIAVDMAKELDLPEDRVVEAMRKALGARFDRRRDEALKCFDDKKNCAPAKLKLHTRP